MSNFKFLISDPGMVAFAGVAVAAESPLRPVCALGTSPRGRGEGLRGEARDCVGEARDCVGEARACGFVGHKLGSPYGRAVSEAD